MNKAFSNFTWENFPSDKTPVNKNNLNKIKNKQEEIVSLKKSISS